MIRFKCIYCGQRILAPDNGAGKKGKCPKCRHLLTVSESTKGKPAISPDIPEETQRQREAAALSSPAFTKAQEQEPVRREVDEWVEIVREKAGWFIPTYDNLSLFLMAVTWILLYAVNSCLRRRIHTFLIEANDWKVTVIVLSIPVTVLILGIYQVFTKREKSDFESTIMLWFAIATNVFTSIIASVYIIKNDDIRNWQIIFPIWNLVNAVVLYLMLVANLIDENCIIDREAAPFQIFFGLVAAIMIVLFCNYAFKLHWSITFSICIVYTTSFDRALQSVFPGLADSRTGEQK